MTCDRHATEGLRIEDIVEAISAQYGTETRPDALIGFPTNELHRSTEKVIARWEDSHIASRTLGLHRHGALMECRQRVEAGDALKVLRK